jgi:5'-nucleotidase
MRILVSNDDGYFSPGIAILAERLGALGEVTVVAPERDRSGASNSLTLDRPLTVRRAANGFLYVNGTPTDCVHLALTGLMQPPPDMVVSGTVAAATEGFLFGIPSLAVSLASKEGRHFETAAAIAVQMVERFGRAPIRQPVLLNVNVPDLAMAAVGAIEATRLGRRHKAEPVVKMQTPRGEAFWIGAAGEAQDAGPGTDFHAVAAGRVSVTPLQIDLTLHQQLPMLGEWLAR